jgi:hypothetical protein
MNENILINDNENKDFLMVEKETSYFNFGILFYSFYHNNDSNIHFIIHFINFVFYSFYHNNSFFLFYGRKDYYLLHIQFNLRKYIV